MTEKQKTCKGFHMTKDTQPLDSGYTCVETDKLFIAYTKKDYNKLKEELQYKEDRISDLLVERDREHWDKKCIPKEKVGELLEEADNYAVDYGHKKYYDKRSLEANASYLEGVEILYLKIKELLSMETSSTDSVGEN